MPQDQENLPTIAALVMGAEVAQTDIGVFAGVINQTTPEERAGVKDVADLISLYFKTHERLHRQVTEEIKGMGEEPPAVNLADFEKVLAENFRPAGSVVDMGEAEEVPTGITLH